MTRILPLRAVRFLAQASACVVITLGVAASPAAAQFGAFGQNKIQYRPFDWRVLRGEHVDLYYYPEEEELGRVALTYAEESYAALERRLANEGSVELAICLAPDAVLDDVRRTDLSLPAWRDELVRRVRAGQEEIVMSAQVGNRPVIVLHGRADSLIPVNHSSRAYYAVNRRDRGERDELCRCGWTRAQHWRDHAANPQRRNVGVRPLVGWRCRHPQREHPRQHHHLRRDLSHTRRQHRLRHGPERGVLQQRELHG